MFDPEIITEWTVGQLAWHLQAMHMRLFWANAPAGEPPYAVQLHQARESSPLRGEIELLCRIANGAPRETSSEAVLAEVADTAQGIVEITAGPAVLAQYTINDGYWATPVGELIASVIAWQRGDDLIGYAEAGRLLSAAGVFPAALSDTAVEQRVRRLQDGGYVGQRYRNPAPDGDRRGAWLLSRQSVETYAHTHGETTQAQWGGARPGAGRPKE